MTLQEAIAICKEMQKWRRGEDPYDGLVKMPYTPGKFGDAIDMLIKHAEGGPTLSAMPARAREWAELQLRGHYNYAKMGDVAKKVWLDSYINDYCNIATEQKAIMESLYNSEKWVPIFEYNNYEVSNYGRIRNISSGKLLSPVTINKQGYKGVTLCKDKKHKRFLIHRLVATHFIPNPYNLPMVNHKDENPSNNNASNLEWCDAKYNTNYGSGLKRMIETKNINHSYGAECQVEQLTKDGKVIAIYKSLMEASRITGIPFGNIGNVCQGFMKKDKSGRKYVVKTAGGYMWRYCSSNKKQTIDG